MSPLLTTIELVVLGAIGYLTVGAVVTLATAYVSATRGQNWFSSRNASRWTDGNGTAPPVVVTLLWPIAIPIALLYGLVAGWTGAVEYLADRVHEAGAARAKKLRGGGP